MSVRIPGVGTPMGFGEVELKSSDWNDSFVAALKDGAYDASGVSDLVPNSLAVFRDNYKDVNLPSSPILGDFVKLLLKDSVIGVVSGSSNVWFDNNKLISSFSVNSTNEVFSELLTDATNSIESVSFSSDNNFLAVGSLDTNVYIYSVSDWSLITTLTDATNWVRSVDFSSDNNFLAVGDWGSSVYIYSVSDWNLTTTLTDATDGVQSVSFSNDNNFLAVGSRDTNVRIYDVSDWSLITTLTDATDDVLSVSFSSDNNFLAVSGRDYNVYIYRTIFNTITKNNVELIYNGNEWVIKD